jgi:hypothetical protein
MAARKSTAESILRPGPRGDCHLAPLTLGLSSQQCGFLVIFDSLTKKDKNVVKILSFDWEPDHAPELRNSFEDSEGRLWQVWIVPEGFLGQVF